MYKHISHMEPLYPARTDALEDLARELVAASAKLEGRLAPGDTGRCPGAIAGDKQLLQ